MSDAAVLLQQIQSEPLSTLLASLRRPSPLPSPLLTLFPNLPTLHIVDIHSPSHTGKTHLLYYLITQIVLPDCFPGYIVRLTSSPARAVLFIDCDARFDIHRLRRVIATFISDRFAESLQGGFLRHNPIQTPSKNEINEVIVSALSNIYVFQPTSGMGLLSTIKGLPKFLSEPGNEYLTIGLICIDSLSAFHHVIRATDKFVEYYNHLAISLRSLSKLFDVPVVTTSWSLFAQTKDQNQGGVKLGVEPSDPHSASAPRPAWSQYFPVEWLRAIDRRIILQTRDVRRFVTGMTLAEAEKERETRMEVVKKGAVMGWVEHDEKREFEMYITDEGVRISS